MFFLFLSSAENLIFRNDLLPRKKYQKIKKRGKDKKEKKNINLYYIHYFFNTSFYLPKKIFHITTFLYFPIFNSKYFFCSYLC